MFGMGMFELIIVGTIFVALPLVIAMMVLSRVKRSSQSHLENHEE